MICFGDSNTWGYDPRGGFGGRYDRPWPEILAEETGWKVSNQGMNGREIPRKPLAFPEETELLVVMLGTNDLLQGASAEAAMERMKAFLESLAQDRKNILLVAPPPLKPGEWVQDPDLIARSLSLAKGYQALAAALGIRFADAGQWNIPLAYDGVHFTQEGHRAFAEGIQNQIEKGAETIC